MAIREMSRQGILAAVYVVCCIIFAPISFGMIQFRLSEMLVLYAFYNRKNTVGLSIGCLIANLFSPLGIVDILFGTIGTVVICLVLSTLHTKKLVALCSAVITGLGIGTELHFVMGLPFLLSVITVALGEFVVVQAGVFIFMFLEKQPWFKS